VLLLCLSLSAAICIAFGAMVRARRVIIPEEGEGEEIDPPRWDLADLADSIYSTRREINGSFTSLIADSCSRGYKKRFVSRIG